MSAIDYIHIGIPEHRIWTSEAETANEKLLAHYTDAKCPSF
jgi:hypothetical protein